jgi:ABC-type sugar transport system ATPase subunit
MLEAQGIRKTYGATVALDDAGIVARPGFVHALLGENGAGKSTLVKILTGAVKPDAGALRLDGREVSFANTASAAAAHVAIVSQELTLYPDLDVLANLFPACKPRIGPFVHRSKMRRVARPVLDQLALRVSTNRLVGTLSLAERQLLEIAKALLTEPRVLLLDEPTSALEPASTERLFQILRVLRERDVAVVFVSHILQEVLNLCDEVTVLRDGAVVMASEPIANLTMPRIVESMLGEAVKEVRVASTERDAPSPRERGAPDSVALRLEQVSVPRRLTDVSLECRAGEIVGLIGIAGAGHQTVLEVTGGLRKTSSGKVTLPGARAAPRSFRSAVAGGVAYVSGDRRRLGLMLEKPLWENIEQVRAVGLAREGLLVRAGPLRIRASKQMKRLGIRASSPEAPASQLSGGNQQKAVIAKWLECDPTTLLLDDPTRGVDIGSKVEIHSLLREIAADGAVVLLCSTDLDELVTVCDRVVVFYRGRVCAELDGANLTTNVLLETINTGEPPPDAPDLTDYASLSS